MKAIKFVSSNADVITAALKEVAGNATTHTFGHAHEIDNLLKVQDIKLEKLVGAKKYKAGALCSLYSCRDSVARSYRGTRIGTVVKLERRSSEWYIVAINRRDVYQDGDTADSLLLTDEQDVRAVALLRSTYGR